MRRRRLIAVAATAAVAFVALALAVAHRTEPLRIDKTVDDFLFLKVPSEPRVWIGRLTHAGSAPVVAALTIVCAGYAWLRRRSTGLALWCVATPLAAGLLEVVLKRMVGRRARTPIDSLPGVAHLVHPPYTFPSGHVVGLAAVAAVFVVLAGTTPHRRLLASIAAAVAVLGVGYTRVALGAHTFTDVAGGLLLGLVVGAIAATR